MDFISKNFKIFEFLQKAAKDDTSEVASIAVRDGDSILMGKRRDNGRYTLPGGHLDKGEEKSEGAVRELFEEAGIKVGAKDLRYLGSEDVTTYTGKKKKIHAFTYKHDGERPTTKHDPDKEVEKWEWIDCKDGVPREVAENMHTPFDKNCVFNFLEMKIADKVEKAELKKVATKTLPSKSRTYSVSQDHEHPTEAYYVNYENPDGTHDIHHMSDDGTDNASVKDIQLNSPKPMMRENTIPDYQADDHILSLPIIRAVYEYADPTGSTDLSDHGPRTPLLSSEKSDFELYKSNYGPKYMKLYNQPENAQRKMSRTGTEAVGAGPNKDVKQVAPSGRGTSKDQAHQIAMEAKRKSKFSPVKIYSKEEIAQLEADKNKKLASSEELDKGVNGDWKTEGYKFRHHRGNPDYHVIQAYLGRKKVGHIAYNKRSTTNANSPYHGYHDVPVGHVEEGHRGKGLYQEMIRMASDHVKQLGGKGIVSQGFQRSPDATRAWKKVNPEIKLDDSARPREDLYLSELEKSGYEIKHTKDWSGTTVTAHHNGMQVGQTHVDNDGLATGTQVHPIHRMKGVDTAMHDHAEKVTGKRVKPGGMQSPEQKKYWQGRMFKSEMKNHLEKQEFFDNVAPGSQGYTDNFTQRVNQRISVPAWQHSYTQHPVEANQQPEEQESHHLFDIPSYVLSNLLHSGHLMRHPKRGIIRNRKIVNRGDGQPLMRSEQGPLELIHYSPVQNLRELDPEKMGTSGVRSGGQYKYGLPNTKTTFSYIKGTEPEKEVTQGAKSKYKVHVHPEHLYDLMQDPKGLVKQTLEDNQGAWNTDMIFSKIKDSGYQGIWAPNSDHPVLRGTVQLFHPHPIQTEEAI